MTTKTNGCIQPLQNQIDNSYFRQPDAQISKAIAERSDGIFDHGQMRWKEHELSFPDCIKTANSEIGHRNSNGFLPVLN